MVIAIFADNSSSMLSSLHLIDKWVTTDRWVIMTTSFCEKQNFIWVLQVKNIFSPAAKIFQRFNHPASHWYVLFF